jgi:hypothetical protein
MGGQKMPLAIIRGHVFRQRNKVCLLWTVNIEFVEMDGDILSSLRNEMASIQPEDISSSQQLSSEHGLQVVDHYKYPRDHRLGPFQLY